MALRALSILVLAAPFVIWMSRSALDREVLELGVFRFIGLLSICCALAQAITALVQGKKYHKQPIVVMATIGIVLGGLAGIAGFIILGMRG